MAWPDNWFEWLWTVASLLVIVDTSFIVYNRFIQRKGA